MSFNNKVIWSTGASSGYGEAMAKAFSNAGAKLILSARNQDKLNILATSLPHAVILPLDLAQIDTFKQKVEQAIAIYGQIDYIIHNGALTQNAPVLETNLAVERYLMDVDYFSYTELTRCILPHMLNRNSGHIVVISGLMAQVTLPRRSTYAAAKAALIAYFGCLRAELVNTDICISVLIPGAMQTELKDKAINANGEVNKILENNKSPLTGCPLDEAVNQTLQAIEQKRTQCFIGLQDQSYHLWQAMLTNPEPTISAFLQQLKK